MDERKKMAVKAVMVDGICGGIAGGALALVLRNHLDVNSDAVQLCIVAAALVCPPYFIAIMLSARKTIDKLDASPHFGLVREAGMTEFAKGKVLGSVASAALTLCCAVGALYTMTAWPTETGLLLAGVFTFAGWRALGALQVMGAVLRIYETAERRLQEIDDDQPR